MGESGTGKELAALALHQLSSRARGPLVCRSAVTLPEGIIDAELFGNSKNFPNAGMPERPGLIGECAGGTLFFDEFAGFSSTLQAHLLRVLDAGHYHRLGEAAARHSDFRLVVATNDSEGTLKRDLAARLLFRIQVPPLSARREDIPLLARHLLRKLAAENPAIVRRFFSGEAADGEPMLSAELICMLLRHDYRTHVRELERLLWMAIEQSAGNCLTLDMSAVSGEWTPRPDSARLHSTAPANESHGLTAEQIQQCIDRHNGALEPTWRELGLKNRHALARLIVQHGIQVTRRLGQGPIRRKAGS
jgi:DNA-binding NtrC family response regulator